MRIELGINSDMDGSGVWSATLIVDSDGEGRIRYGCTGSTPQEATANLWDNLATDIGTVEDLVPLEDTWHEHESCNVTSKR